jgi:hypothetical protein
MQEATAPNTTVEARLAADQRHPGKMMAVQVFLLQRSA